MKRPKLLFADLLFWLILLLTAGLCRAAVPPDPAEEEKRGADVFVTSRNALLRETATATGKVVAQLPQAARLTLLEGADAFLHVEAPPDSPGLVAGGVSPGTSTTETTTVFERCSSGTADMVTVGRALARNPTFG